jgi:hypothetical protein
VRVSLWTTATNRPIVYSPGEKWVWTTMLEWYRQGKPLIRPLELRQSYQQSSSSKAGGNSEEMNLAKRIFVHTPNGFLTRRKILRHVADGVCSLWSKVCCGFLTPLKIHRHQSELNPRTLGPVVSTPAIESPGRTTSLYTGVAVRTVVPR